jgi:hypothetical protein
VVKNDKKITLDDNIIQANFSAMLYLLTEQQFLIGKLLQVLVENGIVSTSRLDKITDPQSGDGLIPTYTQLYERFAHYYLRTKKLLNQESILDDAMDDAHGTKGNDRKDKDDE